LANTLSCEVSDSNAPPHRDESSESPVEVGAEVIASSQDGETWRGEVSARLNRYRARRKVRPPRYPSLNLRFEAFESATHGSATTGSLQHAGFEPISNHALALDGLTHDPSLAAEMETQTQPTGIEDASPPVYRAATNPSAGYGRVSDASAGYSTGHTSAKIIEFPRFAWGPPASPPDQLAEPVSGRPRILDVPEIEPPLPALGGITIEAVEPKEIEKRLGIDIPLQSAPFVSRVVAAVVDGIIVAAASALFGFIFWKVAAVRPPSVQLLGLVAGLPCVFWAAFQYLLVIYAGSTPGMRIARLELARFDGTATSRSLRRWRVLAGYLSAAPVGMGYAWVFLDEDALCWHDRITHTYLAPKRHSAAD